jgi:hypothetical protein
MNPDFSWDGGAFALPRGWNLLGDAGVDSGWSEERGFFFSIGGTLPLEDSGAFLTVEVVPGHRYRLSADIGLSGNDAQFAGSIGLAPFRILRSDRIIWSPDRGQSSWERLSVEAVATERTLNIVLRQKNINDTYPALQGAWFDNVRLEDLGAAATATPTPGPTPTPTPAGWRAPSNDPFAIQVDLGRLAYAFDGVRTRQRASTAGEGQHPNADFNNYQGEVSDGGETWQVLHESHQPGAILRIWMTGFHRENGKIRIYLDNPTTPIVDTTIRNFMSGSHPLFPRPMASPNSGGWANYMPMPYTNFCRVQVKGHEGGTLDRFYYQVTYQDYDSAEGMDTFPPTAEPHRGNARRMEAAWSTHGFDPKPPFPAASVDEGIINLGPGETKTFWSGEGVGQIDQLWLNPAGDGASETTLRNLWLMAFWDGGAEPAVNVPIGIFFGNAYDERIVRSLMIGMTPVSGYYCYFPMPFHQGAVLKLRNNLGGSITNLRYKIVHRPRPAVEAGEMRFHASYDTNANAGSGGLYVPLDISGRGHFCGVVMGMKSNAGSFHFLEGDEHIFVEGEEAPSIQGTGAEDYFTCGWYFERGPMCFPEYGMTQREAEPNFRVSAYRLHVSDYVPFTTSFRFGIEVGESETDPASGDYQTVSYYYLAPENLESGKTPLGIY